MDKEKNAGQESGWEKGSNLVNLVRSWGIALCGFIIGLALIFAQGEVLCGLCCIGAGVSICPLTKQVFGKYRFIVFLVFIILIAITAPDF